MDYILLNYEFLISSVLSIVFFVNFPQNLKVAVPDCISIDLGKYFLLLGHFECMISVLIFSTM